MGIDKKKQGRSNKIKGSRVEREIVHLHKDNNIDAKRVPLSGAVEGYKGDIIVSLPNKELVAEVKARKNGNGFTTIEKWLGDNDILFLKRNNKESLVVLPFNVYINILSELRLQTDLADSYYDEFKRMD
jgi:Holliday junction resolvase